MRRDKEAVFEIDADIKARHYEYSQLALPVEWKERGVLKLSEIALSKRDRE